MTEQLLVTIEDVRAIRQISMNIVPGKMEPYIAEAQNFDTRPMLGDALWFDLLRAPENPIYQKLLKGGDYTNTQNQAVRFYGLKLAIAYYAASRYVLDPTVDTAFGQKIKTNDFSLNSEAKMLAMKSNQAKLSGNACMDEVICFLNSSATTYPLWRSNCKTKSKINIWGTD